MQLSAKKQRAEEQKQEKIIRRFENTFKNAESLTDEELQYAIETKTFPYYIRLYGKTEFAKMSNTDMLALYRQKEKRLKIKQSQQDSNEQSSSEGNNK